MTANCKPLCSALWQLLAGTEDHFRHFDADASRFDLLERRVDLAEGRVEAYDVGRKHSLEDEISQLASGDAIEAELAKLKAKITPAKKD